MSVYKLITQFLLLVSKNSILIWWNVHLEDYFEGWIWLKDIILLYSLFILSLSIINIYISMYMFFCKYLFKIINHSLLYIESSTFSNQDKIFDIKLKQKLFMSKYSKLYMIWIRSDSPLFCVAMRWMFPSWNNRWYSSWQGDCWHDRRHLNELPTSFTLDQLFLYGW